MTTGKTILLILLILVAWIIVVTVCHILRHRSDLPQSADIVIIGSGPGGCVMARRLKEKYPHLSIVLLERGKDYRDDRKVYRSEAALEVAYSAPYSEVLPCDFPGAICSIATMVGGGSQHNFGLVVKGSSHFLREEFAPDFHTTDAEMETLRKRVEGRMDITPLPTSINLLARAIPSLGPLLTRGAKEILQGIDVVSHIGPLRANEELSKWLSTSLQNGFQLGQRPVLVEDYNSSVHDANLVCHTPRLFVDPVLGIRAGAARAYLPLDFQTIERADVDTIDTTMGHGNDSIHLVRLKDGRHIRAKRKVILSAGAIHSPFILIKSGFAGDIGSNLMNHYGCTMVLAIRSRNPDFSSGPLAFLSEDGKKRKWEIVTSGSTLTNLDFLSAQGIDVAKIQAEGFNFVTFLGWILRPRARGSVKASPGSSDPTISLEMFGNDDDNANVIELMRYFGDVCKRLERQVGNPACEKVKLLFPQPGVFERNDPSELLAIAKVGLSQTDHYSGTCAYGKVLNRDFSLKEDKNIHVVDASAFPSIPDGNTEFPTLLLAELAASRIRL